MLPFTTVAVVLVVVACGPTRDYVPITSKPQSQLATAFQLCRESLKDSRVHRPTETSSVAICVSKAFAEQNVTAQPTSLEAVSGTGSETPVRTAAETIEYVMGQLPVSYDIKRSNRTLQLKMTVGLALPEKLDEKSKQRVETVLYNVCLPKIRSVFRRSSFRNGVDLGIDFDYAMRPVKGEAPKLDQILHLDHLPAERALVMSHWPDQAKFYPDGVGGAQGRCDFKMDDPKKPSACQRALEAANLNFCASLAKMAGYWLGLTAPVNEYSRCAQGATSVEEIAMKLSDIAMPKPEAESPYMKGASQNAADFFEKGQLSEKDVKTIFAPACPWVKNLPDEPKPGKNLQPK